MAADAELLNWTQPEDAPENSLDARQLVELKKGVSAAIEDADRGIGVPGELSAEHWNHAGVGVSIWMHESGVVVMSSEGDTLVTGADTLDHISRARTKFFADPGPASVASDRADQEDA